MNNNYNEERKQAGEILPPMLLDRYWIDCMAWPGCVRSEIEDSAFKAGMELSYQLLLSHLKAALPHYEAGVRDTRLRRADASVVLALAEFTELATYT